MSKTRTICLFVIFGLAACTRTQKENQNTQNKATGYQIGDTVADFTLKNINDSSISLSNYTDKKGVVVIFTCNHCPFAKAYEDRIISLNAKIKKDYPILSINPNNPELEPEDGFDEMKVRAKEKGFNFPYLFDEGQKIYPIFGATKTPHVFFLQNSNGSFVLRYTGTIDDNYQDAESVKINYIEAAINSIENSLPIEPTITKAIGCGIKA